MIKNDFLTKRQKFINAKNEIPKDYSINFKNLEINSLIYSSLPFIFGDKKNIELFFDIDEDFKDIDIDEFYDDFDLFEQFLGDSKTNSPNFFSLITRGSKISPIYLFMIDEQKDKVVNHLFIPTFLFTVIGIPNIFYEKKETKKKNDLKKSIETFINPKNNKWIFLKDLEIPSKELIASSSNYVKGKDFHDEWTKIFKSKEKFKVYAVISKKSELLKMYNSQDTRYSELYFKDSIHEPYQNVIYEGLLEGDLTFHGIMLY